VSALAAPPSTQGCPCSNRLEDWPSPTWLGGGLEALASPDHVEPFLALACGLRVREGSNNLLGEESSWSVLQVERIKGER
jgi:hypothetical protein